MIKKFIKRTLGIHSVKFGDDGTWEYKDVGKHGQFSMGESPFDIVAIEKAPEPVRVELYGYVGNGSSWCDFYTGNMDTHRITFNTINGEPDLASIAMEKL